MAVLQKIREKSGLLIGVIGLSLFAFIIGGLLNGGSSLSSRNVGSINGVDIPTRDYLMKLERAGQNSQVSSSQANNMVWSSEVRSVILASQFEKVGLRMGKDQLMNVIKSHPNFGQNPQFLNEAGKFDVSKFNTFVAQMREAGAEQWNAWLAFEAELENFAKEQMYYTMIKSAVVTTNAEAKFAYQKDNDKATFDFVGVSYKSINDDQAVVTDADIIAYVKKHENQFKAPHSREVEYVFIPNKPSTEDIAAAKTVIDDLMNSSVVFNKDTNRNDTVPGFRTTTNLIDFVNLNSDVAFDSTYYAKTELMPEFAENLYNLTPGQTFGPYLFNDHYCVSRLINKKTVTETVDASHILISYKGAQAAAPTIVLTKEEAKAKAESLLSQAQANPAGFAILATENTDDPGSKTTGGKYEGIRKGQMVPQFDAFVFDNPTGKLGVVETDYGFHVIKVDNKVTKEAVQLATLAKTIEPSDKTADELFTKATKFEEGSANTNFDKLATTLGLTAFPATKIGPFEEDLPGVGPDSQAIKWAYNKHTSVGDINRFDNNDGHLIIKLTSINNTGLMSANEARGVVEPILQKEKKAAIISKQMTGATIEEVAKNAKVGIKIATDASGTNALVPEFGIEPQVVGNALALKANENSKLIVGNNGVFMIKTKSTEKAPELPNYSSFKNRVTTNNRNTTQNSVFQALYNNAKIDDNRAEILQ